MGASLKALFAFWEVTTTLEGLAAGAGQRIAEPTVQGRMDWRAWHQNKGNTKSDSDSMLTY
ncbi:hypothetical protein Q73_13565 [Bacillus coahuilensis m2-6]|nr:hypothetical protein Q73_13565 [Bacillus coahuilensis m2-6]